MVMTWPRLAFLCNAELASSTPSEALLHAYCADDAVYGAHFCARIFSSMGATPRSPPSEAAFKKAVRDEVA